MRLHINWVDSRCRFAFEHGVHPDAWKRALLEEEINTTRVVAVVTLKYSKVQGGVGRLADGSASIA
jgi:hypothetical protein